MDIQTNHSGTGLSDGGPSMAAGIQAASAGAHAAIDQVSDSARPAVDRLAGEAHAMVDRLAGAAGSANASLVRRSDQLSRAGNRITAECRTYVGDHPLAAVGMAMAAGFLVSRLMRSR